MFGISENSGVATTSSSSDFARQVTGAIGAWLLQVQEEATLRMLAPYPGATILNVSEGPSQIAEALVEHDYDLTVLGSTAACREHIQPLISAEYCTFETGDLLNLPYEDRAFGVVIAYRLLANVDNWTRLVAELSRVAEKAVIIDYPEAKSIAHLSRHFFHLRTDLQDNAGSHFSYRRADLLRIFKQNSFIYNDHFAEFFVPTHIHSRLKMPAFSQFVEQAARFPGLTSRLGSPVILKVIREQIQP